MAVSCGLIRLAKDLKALESLEYQIMDRSSMWICAFKRRLELGGDVSLKHLREFPEEFSELISKKQSENRKKQKEGFLSLKNKIKSKTLTFEDIYISVTSNKRYKIPEKIFFYYYLERFNEINDYSNLPYKYTWFLFAFFKLRDFDKKYYSFYNNYKESKKIYELFRQDEIDEAMN
jgi:hypothetical protein